MILLLLPVSSSKLTIDVDLLRRAVTSTDGIRVFNRNGDLKDGLLTIGNLIFVAALKLPLYTL